MKKKYIFSEVVNLTLKEIMKSNSKTVLFGLGVDDPKVYLVQQKVWTFW